MRSPAVLALALVSAALLPLAGAGAAVAADVDLPPAEFHSSGTVEVLTDTAGQYFRAGTEYWLLEFTSPTAAYGFIGSWERASGVWTSPEEARAYLAGPMVAEVLPCRLEALREWAATYPTAEAFLAEYGTGVMDEVVIPGSVLQDSREACPTEWNFWSRTVEEWDSTTGRTVIRIPLSVMGPGTHEVFVIPFVYETEYVELNSWRDGTAHWNSIAGYQPGEAATTTVTVPGATPEPDPKPTEPTPEPTPAPSAPPVSDLADVPWWAWIAGGSGLLLAIAVIVAVIVLVARGRPER